MQAPMFSRLVILALCIRLSCQAYAGGQVAYVGRAPIQLMGHKATSSVIAPQGFAGFVRRDSKSPAAQKLVAMDSSTMSPSTVPYFTVMPDETITLGDGQCVEANADRSGYTVKLNSCSGIAAQKWNWIPDGEGQNMIQLKDTSKCLAVSDSTFGSNEAPPIVLHECGHQVTNVWKFEEPPMPQPALQSSASGFRNFALSMMALIGVAAVSLGAWSRHASKSASSQCGAMDIEGGVALSTPLATRSGVVSMSAAGSNAMPVVMPQRSSPAGELGAWIAENVAILMEKISDDVQTNLGKQKMIQDLESQLEELQASKACSMTVKAVTELKETITSGEFKAEVARNIETATPYAREALANLMALLEEFDQKLMSHEKVQELEASVVAVQEVLVEDVTGRKFAKKGAGARTTTPMMDANLAETEESSAEESSALTLKKGVKVTKDVVSATATSVARFTETNTAARIGDVGSWLAGKVRDLLGSVGDKAKENPKIKASFRKLEGEVDELEATGNVGALGGKILKSVADLGEKLKDDGAGSKLLAKIDELTTPEAITEFENLLAKVQATETYQFIAAGASNFGSWLLKRTGNLLKNAGDALQKQKTVSELGDKLDDLKSTKGYAATSEALGNLKEKVTSEEFKADVSRTIEKAKPVAKEALSKLEELLKKFDEKVMTKEGIADLRTNALSIGEAVSEAGKSTKK